MTIWDPPDGWHAPRLPKTSYVTPIAPPEICYECTLFCVCSPRPKKKTPAPVR